MESRDNTLIPQAEDGLIAEPSVAAEQNTETAGAAAQNAEAAPAGGGREEDAGGRMPVGATEKAAAVPDDLIESILRETRAELPVHPGKGGGVVATPARSASTIQEAGEILKNMLRAK